MSDWKVESLRTTGFSSSADVGSVEGLWSEIVGSPPEQIEQRPKEGVSNAVGPFEGGALNLASTRTRIDWHWSGAVDAMSATNQFPSLGNLEAATKTFTKLSKDWLNSKPQVHRLAWGGVLLMNVENKEAGYRKISEYLPDLKIDPVGSSELLYRINRPRASKVAEGLRIVRLSTWSVVALHSMSMQFTISAGVANAQSAPAAAPSISACRLQFDINTDPLHKDPIEAELLVPLLDELVTLATEISVNGDVP